MITFPLKTPNQAYYFAVSFFTGGNTHFKINMGESCWCFDITNRKNIVIRYDGNPSSTEVVNITLDDPQDYFFFYFEEKLELRYADGSDRVMILAEDITAYMQHPITSFTWGTGVGSAKDLRIFLNPDLGGGLHSLPYILASGKHAGGKGY